MSKPNYLVIGVNGSVGSALYEFFLNKGETIYGTTQRLQSVSNESIFYLNLLDNFATWPFHYLHFDVVFLCAGICSMAFCEDDPLGTRKVNIDGMTTWAKYFAERGSFIVYLSTNQVFSGREPFAASSSLYQPLNEYGRQKAEVEAWIKSLRLNAAIVRLTKVIPKRFPLLQTWVNQLKLGQEIEAFDDMQLAPVALRQVVHIIAIIGEKRQAGCYQISGAEDISYYQLAYYLADRLNGSKKLVRAVSAIDKGIKNIFLPKFTSLDFFETTLLCGHRPPVFSEVVDECCDF